MPLKLYLARHGETPYNAAARYQGQQDSFLTPRGREQAQRLGLRLASVPLDAAYASDLRRTRQTLRLALQGRSVPCQFNPFWREVSYGRWEGLTYDQVKRRWPDQLSARLKNPATVAPPGGENMSQLLDRILQGLRQLRDAHPDGVVLLVSHGGVLRTLLCHLLGISLDHYWKLRLDVCSLSVLDLYPAGAIVSLLNDTAHLDGLLEPESNVFLRWRSSQPDRRQPRAHA